MRTMNEAGALRQKNAPLATPSKMETKQHLEPENSFPALDKLTERCERIDAIKVELQEAITNLQRPVEELAAQYDLERNSVFDFSLRDPIKFVREGAREDVPEDLLQKLSLKPEWKVYMAVKGAYHKALDLGRDAVVQMASAFSQQIQRLNGSAGDKAREHNGEPKVWEVEEDTPKLERLKEAVQN